jgi:hypothetical protein
MPRKLADASYPACPARRSDRRTRSNCNESDESSLEDDQRQPKDSSAISIVLDRATAIAGFDGIAVEAEQSVYVTGRSRIIIVALSLLYLPFVARPPPASKASALARFCDGRTAVGDQVSGHWTLISTGSRGPVRQVPRLHEECDPVTARLEPP